MISTGVLCILLLKMDVNILVKQTIFCTYNNNRCSVVVSLRIITRKRSFILINRITKKCLYLFIGDKFMNRKTIFHSILTYYLSLYI